MSEYRLSRKAIRNMKEREEERQNKQKRSEMFGNLMNFATREPALVRGIVTSIIALVTAFGFAISEYQTEAILGAGGAILMFLQAFSTRGGVYTEETVAKMVREAEEAAYKKGQEEAIQIRTLPRNATQSRGESAG